MAPFSTTQRPPDVFLLARLCPVLALTCQPARDWPSKILVQESLSPVGTLGRTDESVNKLTTRLSEVRMGFSPELSFLGVSSIMAHGMSTTILRAEGLLRMEMQCPPSTSTTTPP